MQPVLPSSPVGRGIRSSRLYRCSSHLDALDRGPAASDKQADKVRRALYHVARHLRRIKTINHQQIKARPQAGRQASAQAHRTGSRKSNQGKNSTESSRQDKARMSRSGQRLRNKPKQAGSRQDTKEAKAGSRTSREQAAEDSSSSSKILPSHDPGRETERDAKGTITCQSPATASSGSSSRRAAAVANCLFPFFFASQSTKEENNNRQQHPGGERGKSHPCSTRAV